MTNNSTEQLADLGTPSLMLRFWRHLPPRRRKQLAVVSLLMILSAFAEVLTIGAVIPFVTVLVDPEGVFRYGPVEDLAGLLNINQPDELVLPLAVLFVIGVLLAAAIRLAVVWSTTRLNITISSDLAAEAYERTLYQPYSVQVGRNSSEVISGLIQKVEALVDGFLAPAQIAVGSLMTIVSVTVALILIDPLVAVIAVSGFGGGYAVITRVFRGRLKRNSQRIAQEQILVLKAIQEGIGGIRDVLIDGTQTLFLDQFRNSDRPARRAFGSNTVITQAPRIVMEGVAMLLISALAILVNGRAGGIASELPTLGALALGGQRLLPLYQQCYNAATAALGRRALLVNAMEILSQPLPPSYALPIPPPLELETGVECKNIRFRYTEHGPWVIDGLNLTIAKGTRIGLVGTTGSGKSTLLDLLMGLLEPNSGEILVDSNRLEGHSLRAWQKSIGHVPQHIFLADASATENIAFGTPVADINMDDVREAARRAKIAEFIEGEPAGYATLVGERGVQLSGGQRQRIGIARALYKQASVLILDEATNALDSQTEKFVIESLMPPNREATVVLVTHRPAMLKDCDVIIEIADGRIVNQGTFDGLMSTSASFRKTARAAERPN